MEKKKGLNDYAVFSETELKGRQPYSSFMSRGRYRETFRISAIDKTHSFLETISWKVTKS